MSPGLTLFVLRIVLALLLYGFLCAIVWVLWRDIQVAIHSTQNKQQSVPILVNPESGEIYELQPVMALGRNPDNAVVLDSDTVSYEHALITTRDSHWWIEDLGSSNGTLVNSVYITTPLILSEGDIIEIGSVRLRFTTKVIGNFPIS